MRIGWLLLFMAVTGAGFLLMAGVLETSWPLFLIWGAYGLAIPLASRGTDEDDEAPAETS
ncbi:MAG: hypothetical protein WD770_11150 [Actinomycetota bacterium]